MKPAGGIVWKALAALGLLGAPGSPVVPVCRSSDAFVFLNRTGDARREAMGGGGTALSDDAAAPALNPAAAGDATRDEVSLSYGPGLLGSSFGAFEYVHPLASGGGVGARVLSANYGDLPGYDEHGGPTSSYKAGDLSILASYGRPMGASWRWGASLGQVHSTVADASADAYEAGLGALWFPSHKGAWSHFQFGVAARHLGGGGAYESEKAPLPRTLAMGAAAKIFSDAWLLTVDVEKPRTDKARFLLGQECWIARALAVRAGWRSDADATSSVSLGFGFRIGDARVDYSYAKAVSGFDDLHRVGVSWRFGGGAEALYDEAVELMRKGDTAEAVLKLKQVLDINPRHRRAMLLMREAGERMKKEGLPE